MSLEPLKYEYDKTRWGSGPWMKEPDRLEWRHASGLPLVIVRNRMGALCGYVGVPRGHKFYGAHYENVDVDVHGRLTYSDRCNGPICHVPLPGESDDVWWLGFDCAHMGDLVPGLYRYSGKVPSPMASAIATRERYKDVNFVRREVEHLADQLAASSK